MQLNLDQIEVLEAIDRLGSFSAAARELHRATSAVSYAIKSLESTLEVELFDRSGHRARLTAAGGLVLEEGRALIERARRLQQLARQLQQGWEPRLTVVVDGVLPMKPAMRALKHFKGRDLPTRVELRVDYLSGVRNRFHNWPADLMLTVDHESDSNLTTRPLQPMEMLLLAHRSHPLQRESKPLTRSAISSHVELLVAPESSWDLPHIRRMFFGGPHVFELSDFHSKLEALLEGVGFGWMPRHLVVEYLARGDLVQIGFEEGDTYLFTPQLVYRNDVPLGRGAQLFATYLEEEMAAEL